MAEFVWRVAGGGGGGRRRLARTKIAREKCETKKRRDFSRKGKKGLPARRPPAVRAAPTTAMDVHHRLRRDPTWHKDGCNLCGTVSVLLVGGERCVLPACRLVEGKRPTQNSWRERGEWRPARRGRAQPQKKKDADPSPSPTPQIGHQAATCPNGTVNWRDKLGDDAYLDYFSVDPPCFLSDDAAKRPTIDVAAIEAAARAYAEERVASGAAVKEPIPPARKPKVVAPAVGAAGVSAPLPEGWAQAVDAKGRTYFWNRRNKAQVTWTRPTAPAP